MAPWDDVGAVKKSRFSERQIVRHVDTTAIEEIVEIAANHRVSEQTIYICRTRFGKLERAHAKRRRHLEQEYARLKKPNEYLRPLLSD
jgi:putative transposase